VTSEVWIRPISLFKFQSEASDSMKSLDFLNQMKTISIRFCLLVIVLPSGLISRVVKEKRHGNDATVLVSFILCGNLQSDIFAIFLNLRGTDSRRFRSF